MGGNDDVFMNENLEPENEDERQHQAQQEEEEAALLADPTTPLSKIAPISILMKEMKYAEVEIEVDYILTDQARVVFIFAKEFQAKSLEVVENTVSALRIGNLTGIDPYEDLAGKYETLYVDVTFEGKTVGDIVGQVYSFLEELARRLNNPTPAPKTTTVRS